MTWALVAAGALGLAAVAPGPWRGPARAVALFLVILSPVIALGLWMGTWERAHLGTWLLLVPAAFFWLAFLDLRCGLTARLARPPARVDPRKREEREGNGA